MNNYLVSYYKKLEVVYVWETIIKAKTTVVKHIAPKIGGEPYSFQLIYKISYVKYLQYKNIDLVR